MPYFDDQAYTKVNALPGPGEYDRCTFAGCDLQAANLAGYSFSRCTFTQCNLSLAQVAHTSLCGVAFNSCKLLGLHLNRCNPFGLSVSFQDCLMDHCVLQGLKLKKTRFMACQLQEADFTDCDLTGACFDGCNLLNATFENTTLTRADLRTAENYRIHPQTNPLARAKFALPGVLGLLAHLDIVIEA